MNFIPRSTRAAACLGAILLATGCATPGPGTAPDDGIWTGNLGNYDFNSGPNWGPLRVPTGTAIIPASVTQSYPHITFSAASTKLAAIEMKGALGIELAGGKVL